MLDDDDDDDDGEKRACGDRVCDELDARGNERCK
jgi:hypothetical protein